MTKKLFINLLLFVFTVFFIIYFVIQVKSIFIDNIETEYATLATFDDTVEMNCYILRDEILIESALGGTYNYVVSDGEKMSVGQTIANIYTTDSEYQVQEQIRDINDRIDILNESSVEHNYFTLNISKLDKDITNMFVEYRKCIESGEYSLAMQIKDDLLVTLNKRYLVVNAITGFDSALESLGEKKRALMSRVSGSIGSVISPKSGYFYSDVDGYESILTPQLLIKGTVDNNILDTLESDPAERPSNVVGKVVSEFEWYSVCVTDKETAQLFSTGKYYNVSYPYSVGQTIKSLLWSKTVQHDSEKVVLIFQSSHNTDSFNFMRNQIAEVKLDEYEGLRIRKEALRIVDGEEGVFILNGNTIEFKRANKIYENDGYYILSVSDPIKDVSEEKSPFAYIEMYDAVINNGKDLYHGKTIG